MDSAFRSEHVQIALVAVSQEPMQRHRNPNASLAAKLMIPKTNAQQQHRPKIPTRHASVTMGWEMVRVQMVLRVTWSAKQAATQSSTANPTACVMRRGKQQGTAAQISSSVALQLGKKTSVFVTRASASTKVLQLAPYAPPESTRMKEEIGDVPNAPQGPTQMAR